MPPPVEVVVVVGRVVVVVGLVVVVAGRVVVVVGRVVVVVGLVVVVVGRDVVVVGREVVVVGLVVVVVGRVVVVGLRDVVVVGRVVVDVVERPVVVVVVAAWAVVAVVGRVVGRRAGAVEVGAPGEAVEGGLVAGAVAWGAVATTDSLDGGLEVGRPAVVDGRIDGRFGVVVVGVVVVVVVLRSESPPETNGRNGAVDDGVDGEIDVEVGATTDVDEVVEIEVVGFEVVGFDVAGIVVVVASVVLVSSVFGSAGPSIPEVLVPLLGAVDVVVEFGTVVSEPTADTWSPSSPGQSHRPPISSTASATIRATADRPSGSVTAPRPPVEAGRFGRGVPAASPLMSTASFAVVRFRRARCIVESRRHSSDHGTLQQLCRFHDENVAENRPYRHI